MTYPEPVAWKVEVNCWEGLVFATSEAKAKWQGVKWYREEYDSRRGYWPPVSAHRIHRHDKSYLRNRTHRRFWPMDAAETYNP